MPIHLASISRRRFLTRAAMVTTGLALAPELFAKGKAEDSWCLLSDTHIAGDDTLTCRGVRMGVNLHRAFQEVLALPKRPSGVFITGDCAYNSGETADYRRFVELLDPVRGHGVPLHITLGNHDQRQHFRAILREEKTPRGCPADKQAAFLKTPRVHWFLLDSLEQTLVTPGSVGPAQLDWLARSLDASPSKPALVLVHHNPATPTGLRDIQALLDVINPRRQVKALIYGHTHAWSVQTNPSGIHLINLPPVAYVFREGDPSGWVHARVDDQSIRLELRCLNPLHPAHGQVTQLQWRA
jgi:3',5'-cyclic-AMP phosphodiesterase